MTSKITAEFCNISNAYQKARTAKLKLLEQVADLDKELNGHLFDLKKDCYHLFIAIYPYNVARDKWAHLCLCCDKILNEPSTRNTVITIYADSREAADKLVQLPMVNEAIMYHYAPFTGYKYELEKLAEHSRMLMDK